MMNKGKKMKKVNPIFSSYNGQQEMKEFLLRIKENLDEEDEREEKRKFAQEKQRKNKRKNMFTFEIEDENHFIA